MEYECHCGNNYLFVDPLCQGEVIEKLEGVIEEVLTEGNEKAEESLAIIKMVLTSVSSISKFMPDFGESYVSSLDMEVPPGAGEILFFVENPLLNDLNEFLQWPQKPCEPTNPSDCRKCEIIDYKLSIILSFGFFLLGMRRFRETELLKKIIYLLFPFRRKHREIPNYYNQVWKFTLEGKLCSSLYNHIVIFHCQPIEEILSDLIRKLDTKEVTTLGLSFDETYMKFIKAARKSRNVVCCMAEKIVKRFLETRMEILRDLLTFLVNDLRQTVLPSNFIKLFSDNLCQFAAFVLENYTDDAFLHQHIEILKSTDYKKYIELGLSYEKFHYLTENLIEKDKK